ncbi:MAG: OmpP1/FadL family transporter [Pseudomonadota bacterium]
MVRRSRLVQPLCVAGAVFVLLPDPASAAGFAIREQSGSFQGLSYAGVAAGGRDISTMYFNPATLGRHDGKQVHLSVSYIVPRAEFENGTATDRFTNTVSGGDGGDIALDAPVPATYAMIAAGDWRFGLGVTAPFGLETKQPEDWIGRYHATRSELITININPTIAYRLHDRLTVGAGFVAQYADATLGNSVLVAPGVDAQVEVEGDDWDYGFTLGLWTEPLDGTRIGLGYRSQVNHSLSGKRTSTIPAAVPIVGGRAALQTPQIASFGIQQDLGTAWTLHGTVEWTGWSTFDELLVTFDNGTSDRTEERWDDTWFFAVGAEYRPRHDLVLQLGVAYDQGASPDAYRTPRIPDADRTWLSLGADWRPYDWLNVGAAYSHIFVDDGPVALDVDGRGTLRGNFESSVDIVTLQGTLRF